VILLRHVSLCFDSLSSHGGVSNYRMFLSAGGRRGRQRSNFGLECCLLWFGFVSDSEFTFRSPGLAVRRSGWQCSVFGTSRILAYVCWLSGTGGATGSLAKGPALFAI